MKPKVPAFKLLNVIVVDPDLRNSAVIVARPGKVLAVGIATAMSKEVEGSHRSAVMHRVADQAHSVNALVTRCMAEFGSVRLGVAELPLDYGSKRFARPQDIVNLASISGAALGAFGRVGIAVAPADYKGQRPKSVCERDAMHYFGWQLPPRRFRIPENVELLTDIPTRAYEDVRDALVIAKWAILQGRRRRGAE